MIQTFPPCLHLKCSLWIESVPLQELLDSLDADLRYVIEVEGKLSMEDIENYDEVREEIAAGLADLRDVPNRRENPLIYHLDVAAMYPNIILTNRRACLLLSEPASCHDVFQHIVRMWLSPCSSAGCCSHGSWTLTSTCTAGEALTRSGKSVSARGQARL